MGAQPAAVQAPSNSHAPPNQRPNSLQTTSTTHLAEGEGDAALRPLHHLWLPGPAGTGHQVGLAVRDVVLPGVTRLVCGTVCGEASSRGNDARAAQAGAACLHSSSNLTCMQHAAAHNTQAALSPAMTSRERGGRKSARGAWPSRRNTITAGPPRHRDTMAPVKAACVSAAVRSGELSELRALHGL